MKPTGLLCLMLLIALVGSVSSWGEACRDMVHPALRMMPVPAGQGVNIHFYKGNDRDLSMLTESGIGIIRMDVGWSRCEKEPGVYDFGQYDQLIADLGQRGMRLLFIIDYGNPLYDDGLSPHSEECRQAYARFCAALAGRYADKDIIWELWNEPNIHFWKPEPNVDDYIAWCKAVVPAIRKADPSACIIAPATSGIPLDFLEDCFKRGLLTLIDGVSVHPYRAAHQGPETALSGYEQLEALIMRYRPAGRRIPVLSGEWGYSTTFLSPELQGKYLPRQWLANMAAGLPISIWYDWHDDGKDPEEKEHNFGTVTWDYKPKPAYVAMKTLIDQLQGFLPVGRIDTGSDNDFIVAFRRDGAHKLAVWTCGDARDLDPPDDVLTAAAVNHLGKPLDSPGDAWRQVDDAPRYMPVATPVPAWLQMMPLSFEAGAAETAGKEGDAEVMATLRNPSNKQVEVALSLVEPAGVDGAWASGGKLKLAPGETREVMWRGTLIRRDQDRLTLRFAVDVRAEGEETHRFTRQAAFPVLNPMSLRLAWRHDGLQALLKASDSEAFTGELIATVAGREDVRIPIDSMASGVEQVFSFGDVRLAEDPLRVGVRLVNGDGQVVGEIEPMTYQLVDAAAVPAGTDPNELYRLWHEGAEDRQAELKLAAVAAPSEAPPYPKALKIDYDIAEGWCFWQLGPKEGQAMPHPRPKRVMLWVHGDAPGDRICCRVVDATGQMFQTRYESADFEGWRLVELSLEGHMGHWSGAEDGVMHPPLRWESYYLQDPARKARAGTTYLTGIVVAW